MDHFKVYFVFNISIWVCYSIEIFGKGFSWTEFCQISVLFEISRVDARFDAVKMGEFPTKNAFLVSLGVSKGVFFWDLMRWWDDVYLIYPVGEKKMLQ